MESKRNKIYSKKVVVLYLFYLFHFWSQLLQVFLGKRKCRPFQWHDHCYVLVLFQKEDLRHTLQPFQLMNRWLFFSGIFPQVKFRSTSYHFVTVDFRILWKLEGNYLSLSCFLQNLRPQIQAIVCIYTCYEIT